MAASSLTVDFDWADYQFDVVDELDGETLTLWAINYRDTRSPQGHGNF